MNYYIIATLIIIFLIIFCLLFILNSKKLKKRKFNNSFPNNKIYEYYPIINLSYIDKINNETNYLTLKYDGINLLNKANFSLTLLPYKNKENEFKLHISDYLYLKPFYEVMNLYNNETKELLKKITYVTSDYNPNKEQYLELELLDDNIYILKASLWFMKGSYHYLHIDKKNKLYFDEGIQNNIAKFKICFKNM